MDILKQLSIGDLFNPVLLKIWNSLIVLHITGNLIRLLCIVNMDDPEPTYIARSLLQKAHDINSLAISTLKHAGCHKMVNANTTIDNSVI